jgi:hypothetical protein
VYMVPGGGPQTGKPAPGRGRKNRLPGVAGGGDTPGRRPSKARSRIRGGASWPCRSRPPGRSRPPVDLSRG